MSIILDLDMRPMINEESAKILVSKQLRRKFHWHSNGSGEIEHFTFFFGVFQQPTRFLQQCSKPYLKTEY
jgi:hypothetical protein